MALFPGLLAVGKTAITSAALSKGKQLLGNILGGGGPNIARSLSQQVGFEVPQSQAAAVRARLAAGLDPRTGTPAAPGITTRTTGIGSIFRSITTQLASTAIAKLPTAIQQPASQLSQAAIDEIIHRPATGAPPPLTLPSPVSLPPVSKAVLSTQALPKRVMVPPGGGRVSLIPAAMASAGALARIGGRGLLRTTTGRISKIMLPSGQAFSRKNAASLIRRVGFEAAAVALGITIVEAAEILLTDSQTRRRGKGITAAQVRNARSTTRRVACLARDLGIKAAPVRRRKTCRS